MFWKILAVGEICHQNSICCQDNEIYILKTGEYYEKIFISAVIIFVITIVSIILNIYVMSLPPKLKNIEQINLYLKEVDVSTFNKNDIIEVTDKKRNPRDIGYS